MNLSIKCMYIHLWGIDIEILLSIESIRGSKKLDWQMADRVLKGPEIFGTLFFCSYCTFVNYGDRK